MEKQLCNLIPTELLNGVLNENQIKVLVNHNKKMIEELTSKIENCLGWSHNHNDEPIRIINECKLKEILEEYGVDYNAIINV